MYKGLWHDKLVQKGLQAVTTVVRKVYSGLWRDNLAGRDNRSTGGVQRCHTPSTALRHLPPNSARFSYATEGALFISAQLSTDAVSALRKVRTDKTVEAT